MKILLLGSGGREHTLAWKMIQNNTVGKIYISPGNAGTAQIGENVTLPEFADIKNFVAANNIDMVVVGPEIPLVDGIVDYLKSHPETENIPVIGPDKIGAQLEGSKDFAKQFMAKYQIPTAGYFTVTENNKEEGLKFLKSCNAPYVLKADGPAAGKGVLIISDIAEAEKELLNILDGKFGKAGNKVVIEEFLSGIELSVFILTDGINYKILPTAKDYKRIGDNDTGLNTGGMGAVSPVPFADEVFMKKVEEKIIKPTVNGLRSEGIDYTGFIFFGLINVNNEPYVIEYNCRMGDPETEAVIPKIKTDLVDLFKAVANKTLDKVEMETDKRVVCSVVMASGGYPDEFEKGFEITGLEKTGQCLVFHAGTALKNDKICTNGGRVLVISSFGNSIQEARENSYKNAGIINFNNKYYRTDIGKDLMKYIL